MTTLAHLKALLQAATPGPMTTGTLICHNTKSTLYGKPYLAAKWGDGRFLDEDTLTDANTALIAAAVNTLPALIAVAEAAEKYVSQNYPPLTDKWWQDSGDDTDRALAAALTALDAATGKGAAND